MKLFGKSPWKCQPQVAVGIDWSNPLTRGLNTAMCSAGSYFRVTGIASGIFTNSGFVSKMGALGVGTQGAVYPQYSIPSISSTTSISLVACLENTGSWSAQDRINVRAGATNAFRVLTDTTGWTVELTTNAGTITVVTNSQSRVAKIACSYSFASGVLTVCLNGSIFTTSQASGSSFLAAISGFQAVTFSPVILNMFGVIARPLADAELKRFTDNPWQIFQPLGRNLGFSPSAGGNPALTGQSAVAAQGTLTPVMAAVLSGNASAAGQGVLSATLLLPLTGQATSAEQGAVAPVITVALTGQATAVAQGALSVANQDITLALTGQATAVAQGALLAESTTALSGQSTIVAQGAVLPQIDKTLTGQGVALAQGSVLPQTGVALTGQDVSVGQGTIVAPGDLTVALMGVGVTVGQGALTASITPDPGNGKSGVNRMWLIEYYTKEFAKKAPIAVPEEIVGVAAKRNALNRAKAVRAKQIEALAAKAESDLEVLAQGVEDVRAAQQFTYNLIHQAQRQPEPEIDFMRVADSYRKRMKQEDDDLMLFAMVI